MLYTIDQLGPDHLQTMDLNRCSTLRQRNSAHDEIPHADLLTWSINQVFFTFSTEAAYENVVIVYIRLGPDTNGIYKYYEVKQAGDVSPRDLNSITLEINGEPWRES